MNTHTRVMITACYDVGGTNLRAALFRGDTLENLVKEPTQQDFCGQIKRVFMTHHAPYKPDVLAVVVPGPVENGILLKAPPLRISSPINLKETLAELCTTVIVENDLNAAVHAELVYGKGKQYKNFYLLTLSTGIGAGIVHDGKVIGGRSGEFGHNIIEQRSQFQFNCACGNTGCWVSLASGMGISNLARQRFNEEKTAEEVFFLAEKGNADARYIVSMVRQYNALGLSYMVNALDMEAIICMGSLGLHQFEKIIPDTSEIPSMNPAPPIMKTELGDNIGLYGAALVAVKNKR